MCFRETIKCVNGHSLFNDMYKTWTLGPRTPVHGLLDYPCGSPLIFEDEFNQTSKQNGALTLVRFCFNAIYNCSFLSGEGVTIFEGDRRRDSDSCTHP